MPANCGLFVRDLETSATGLEPPTRPLWRDAPAPRTPQWDIFDRSRKKERACDVGRTVEIRARRASGSGGLPQLALALLRPLPTKRPDQTGPYVFSQLGTKPFQEFSRAKRLLDQ